MKIFTSACSDLKKIHYFPHISWYCTIFAFCFWTGNKLLMSATTANTSQNVSCHWIRLHRIIKQIYIDKDNLHGQWAAGALSQVCNNLSEDSLVRDRTIKICCLYMLYRMLIIDRYSHLYSYSSTSTRTRTRTHVIIKYLDSYSHILQVLVLVLVNLVLAPALLKPPMHRALLLCQSNCIATQNPVEHPVCVGSGVVVVNTGIAKVTRLLNEARAENPHHRFLTSQSSPRLICMVRHTNYTFNWPQKMLQYSWQDTHEICLIVELYFVTIYLVNQ